MRCFGAVVAVIMGAMCVCCVSAHLCLMNPEQRDYFPVSALYQQGISNCAFVNSPCGGGTTAAATTQSSGQIYGGTYYSQQSFTIEAVQNAVHYDPSKPDDGTFTAKLCIASQADKYTTCVSNANFQDLLGPGAVAVDTHPNGTTPTVVEIKATMPSIACDGCVLQVIYTPNDGSGPYYQCSDVTVQLTTSTTEGNSAALTFGITGNGIGFRSAATSKVSKLFISFQVSIVTVLLGATAFTG